MKVRALDTSLGFVAILLWSTTVALARSLTEQVGSLTAVSTTFFLGGVLGLVLRRYAGPRGEYRAVDRRYLIVCGALFVAYQACLYAALGMARSRSQVLEVALTNYLWPMLTLVLSVVVLRLRATMWLLPGAVIAMGGVLLATGQNQALSWVSFRGNLGAAPLPYLLGTSAAILWALYSVLSRKWSGDGGAVPIFMLATALVLGLGRFAARESATWTLRSLVEMLAMAVAAQVAYSFWDRAVRKGDIVLVASASYLIPLLSTAVSALYLDVQPGPRLWVGGALVVAGATICRLSVSEGT
jgi:drug/metabolite transporter (DMT)-like permease